MAAYVSRPYDDRASVARMSDLMRDSGALQAQAIQQRGHGWANTVSKMGDLVAGAFQDYQAAKKQQAAQAEADQVKAEQQRIAESVKGAVDPETGRLDFAAAAKAIGQIDPLKAEAFWQQADQRKKQQAEVEAAKTLKLADGLEFVLRSGQQDQGAGPGALQSAPRAYAAFREKALAEGWADPDDLPEQYDEGAVQMKALEVMSGKRIFELLYAAPNAPKTHVLSPGAQLRDDTGRLVAENPRPETPERPATAVVDGRLVDARTGRVLYTSPDAGRANDADADRLTRAQRNAAITARRTEIQRIDALRAKSPLDGGIDQPTYDQMRWEIEKDYAQKVGDPEPPPPRRFGPEDVQASQGSTRDRQPGATMGDLMRDARGPAAPMGAGAADAAPTKTPPAGDNLAGPVRVKYAGRTLQFKDRAAYLAWLKRAGLSEK